MTSSVVFDLYGVLIDSRNAVVTAYAEVGVAMPRDAWGKSWREWLPSVVGDSKRAAHLHTQKNAVYDDMIFDCPELEGAPVARQLARTGYDVGVVTAASRTAAAHVLQKLGLMGKIVGFRAEVTGVRRSLAIDSFAATGIYIDDNIFGYKWMPPKGCFQLFLDDYEALMKEIETWTQ